MSALAVGASACWTSLILAAGLPAFIDLHQRRVNPRLSFGIAGRFF
jgi:hypothetical protein